MSDRPELAPVFRALANPTRRAVLDLLREEPRTTGDLATRLRTSRFAAMQHLGVLVSAGLVVVRRRGRERWNHLNAVPLQKLYERWVRPYAADWAGRLTRLQTTTERMEEPMSEPCGIARVELEVTIAAGVDRVWKAILEETTKWWRADFYVNPQAKRFVIEPRPGGRMYEDWGNGAGCLWGTVLVLDPPKTLDLVCYLTPPYGGPAMSMVRIQLAQKGKAKSTTLSLTDAVLGPVSERTAGQLDEGWRALFGEALKKWVERGTARPGRKKP